MKLSNREKIGLAIIIILAISLFITMWYGVNKNNNLIIANNNINALKDSVTCYRLKNEELMHCTTSLIIEKQELDEYLDITKKEVKDLEKKLNSQLLYISKLEGSSTIDTIYIQNTTTYDSLLCYRYSFIEQNQYYKIAGYTDVDSNHIALTTITENSMNLNLKVGVSEDWKIFVTTDNPYVTFNNINGALLDPNMFLKQQEKKRFSIGIQCGFGAHYGLMRQQFDYGPYIGLGLEFTLFSR